MRLTGICDIFPIASLTGINHLKWGTIENNSHRYMWYFSYCKSNMHKSFITFINDYSRYAYVYLISEKSEALDKFKIYKAEVENQHNLKK
jgi:hypothetical protein